MPYAAPRPCTYPGCKELAAKGSRCQAHPYTKTRTAAAINNNKLYKSQRWIRNRKTFLRKHPICVECAKLHIYKPATVVDHKKPHRGNEALFFDQANWQGLCAKHHNRKTASQDGGFGNKRK